MTVIINFAAIIHFFKAICYSKFKNLLTINSKNKGFLSFISIYFDIVKINTLRILHLYC